MYNINRERLIKTFVELAEIPSLHGRRNKF
jgi:hypothetical protein